MTVASCHAHPRVRMAGSSLHCSSAGYLLKGDHPQVELRTKGCLGGRVANRELPLANTLAQPQHASHVMLQGILLTAAPRTGHACISQDVPACACTWQCQAGM